MVRRKSITAQELDIQVTEAVLGIKSGKFKSAYQAAKVLGLTKTTVTKRLNGGLTRAEARQKQQLLSKNQEKTLLKWIKELTASGYAPSHRILCEVAEEVRSNKCRVFQTQVS
jgi:predicted transcriptional regulator